MLPRQRRRRFAERDLLDKLRHYEGLLREHNISFEPLHKDQPQRAPLSAKSLSSPTVVQPAWTDEDKQDVDTKPSFRAM